MPLTNRRKYRYPASTAAPDLAAHLQALAADVDTDMDLQGQALGAVEERVTYFERRSTGIEKDLDQINAEALASTVRNVTAAAAQAQKDATTALGLLLDAQAPTDDFVASVLEERAGPTDSAAAVRAQAARGQLQVDQLDRQGQGALSMYQGRVRVAHESGRETTESWDNLSGVSSNGVAVDGNRLVYAPQPAPNAAKKPWDIVSPGGSAHAVIDYQGSGVYMFGVAGNKSAAPLTSSTDGFLIGFRAANDAVGYVQGTDVGGNGQGNLDGDTVAQKGRYLASVLVDSSTVALSLKSLATEQEWHKSIPRSNFDAVGGVKSLLVYAAKSGLSAAPSYIEPLTAIANSTTPRTRSVAGKRVLGDVPVVHYMERAADNWRIQLPPTYDARVPTPLVLWLHNNSGTAMNGFTDARMRAFMDSLAAAGYIVASADADGSAWGNDSSRAKYVALYEYVRSRYAVAAVALVGVSMGGQVALNLLPRREIPNIVAYLGIGAVASVEDLWTGYAAPIKTAFGVTSLEKVPAAYRPELRGGHEFRGVPMLLIHSAGDATCHLDRSQDLAARVAPYAPEARVHESTGAHIAEPQFKDAITYGLPFLRKYAPTS